MGVRAQTTALKTETVNCTTRKTGYETMPTYEATAEQTTMRAKGH